LDDTCETSLAADATASAPTSEEYWQVQGTGNSFTTATRIVADGNTYPFAVPYGTWADPALRGRVQLYYKPTADGEKGIKAARTCRLGGGAPDLGRTLLRPARESLVVRREGRRLFLSQRTDRELQVE
jgi:hypothetical protein